MKRRTVGSILQLLVFTTFAFALVGYMYCLQWLFLALNLGEGLGRFEVPFGVLTSLALGVFGFGTVVDRLNDRINRRFWKKLKLVK